MTAIVKTSKMQEKQLEKDYEKIMRLAPFVTPVPEYQENLAQPEPYPHVRTMTTYGAFDLLVDVPDEPPAGIREEFERRMAWVAQTIARRTIAQIDEMSARSAVERGAPEHAWLTQATTTVSATAAVQAEAIRQLSELFPE